jgi:hypothetical protein
MTRLVYVMAASHSGSTLLSMLLNVHPEIVTAGELKATNLGDPMRYRCSCHRLLRECPFWSEVNARMRALGHEGFSIWNAGTHYDTVQSSYARRLLRPLVRDALFERVRSLALRFAPEWPATKTRMLARSVDLVSAVAQTAGVGTVVESSKVGLRLKLLAESGALDVHVVRLIRDGRAVALTYMQPDEFADARDAKLRGGGTGVNQDHRLCMRDAAREWRRSNEEAEALLSQLAHVKVSEVRYESLCAQPLATLNGLFADLGLAAVANLEDFRAVPHHVIGNGMRLDSDSRVVLDDRWRTRLTAAELAEFAEVAGSLSHKYGYA